VRGIVCTPMGGHITIRDSSSCYHDLILELPRQLRGLGYDFFNPYRGD
jgi:hypothetical protein